MTKERSKLGNYKKSGIYMIKNIKNGDYYIGSSNNIGKRWSQHKRELEENKHYSKYLQRAYNKYGSEYFIFGVIEFTVDLKEREQHHIDSLSPKYNVSKYAYEGMRGKTLSKEHRAALSRANKGRKHTKEHKEKIRMSKVGLKLPNGFWMNSVAKREKSLIIYGYGTTYYFKNSVEAAKFLDLKNSRSLNNACKGSGKFKNYFVKYHNDN